MRTLLLFTICLVPSLPALAEPYQATLTTNTETGSVSYELPGTTVFKDLAWKETVNVPVGTVVKTASAGTAKVDIFPGGRMLALPNSSFKVNSLSVQTAGDAITKRQARIALETGTLKTLLSHRGGNTSPINFAIKTPTGVAAARGTKYVVCVVKGITYVEVIEGTVDVNGTLVDPGQIAEITSQGVVDLVTYGDLPSDVQGDLSQAIQTTSDGGLPTINASDAAGSQHAN